jgi:hypothetical protein
MVFLAGHYGLNVPLNSSATLTVLGTLTDGITISSLVLAAFLLPF